jgi:predicted butyrate kinase (DUF1464 family)
MVRVAGTDPGTSSLDVLVLEDGAARDQCRFAPEALRADPALPARWLAERGPFDLVAGPSGYGLPLRAASDCTDRDLDLLALVHPRDRGHAQGVAGFRSLVRAFRDSALPVVFLPGVVHLATVPRHRKFNRVDLGTSDKLCVAALALHQVGGDFCLLELGTAFTACVVVRQGRVVDGLGGTSGPCGWQSGGAWDGEVAYLLGPLNKRDLFSGGAGAVAEAAEARAWFVESVLRAVAGLQAVHAFGRVVLAGRLPQSQPALVEELEERLRRIAEVSRLPSLPGAWVKHAAQGSALLADGLAGGRAAPLVSSLALREAGGTVFDWLVHPRAEELRTGLDPRRTPSNSGEPPPPQDGVP